MFLNIRKLAVVTALLLACATPQTRGNGVYLKQIGPAPLRFSFATATFSFALPSALIERPAVTNSPEIAIAKANSVDTNAVAVQASPIPSPTTGTPAFSNPILPNNSPRTPSASDLLVVSPQMLTEFFKPGPDGTNAPSAVIMPVPVGFTPPSVTPPSSQAIYKNQ